MLLEIYTRLLITGGEETSAQIIDLADPNLVCEPLSDFPTQMDGSGEAICYHTKFNLNSGQRKALHKGGVSLLNQTTIAHI